MAGRPRVAAAGGIEGGVLASYFAVTLLWGLNWPAMKVVVGVIDPWTFRTCVLVLAAATLFALARALGQSLALPRHLRAAILVPALTVTGWHIFSAHGLTFIGGGRAVIVAFTMPFWTMLLALWWLDERPTPRRLAALALGMAGLALLLVDAGVALTAAPVGVLLMLAAALSWATGTVAVKARDWRVSPLVLTAWQLALGAVPIAGVWLWRGAPFDAAALTPAAWFAFAYTTFVAMVFCFYSYIRFVTILPATVAAIGVMAIPAVGLFGSAVLLGEPVGVVELAALALVVGGQALATLGPARG
ncbi:MAG: EamA family transporter [Alphaproteobacteria bacterium]|jgi:drug/metabolite transporter (DMT)-like permease|nr:EamA family transporter [Alphaproteobacteria bacterium]